MMTKLTSHSSFRQGLFKVFITLIIFSPGLIFGTQSNISGLNAYSAVQKSKKKTRKTPAMREKVYSQLATAQKLADDGKINKGLAMLERLRKRSDQLNAYERAMMWNSIAFIHYGNEDIKSTIEAFANVVDQKSIPEALELSTLYSLAQLSMQIEDYSNTLSYIERWSELKNGELDEKSLVLQANAHYAIKNFNKALKSISAAIKLSISKHNLPKENWLILKRALHYELKQTAEITKVSEDLVRLYSKAHYWVELANMYGESGQAEKQLAVMEAAYQQGFVTKKSDIRSLAQQYFFAGTPYKSARLLSEQLEKGVLDKDVSTLQFLAQSWSAAKEDEKAVPVLKQAAAISEDGNIDIRLAEILLNLERWQGAIIAAKKAEQKGLLDNPGNVYVAMGIAYFNLKNFSNAIIYFEKAKRGKKLNKIASQWLKYVKTEKNKHDHLSESEASLGY